MSHKTKLQKLRQRRFVPVWYPRAHDLLLPDVPVGERVEIRGILSWLGKLPVRGGTCWQTSQTVTLLARDARVQYVEGAHWNTKNGAGHDGPMSERADGTLECTSVCTCKPLPHAWNLVNGHVVDLLAEFHNWRFGGDWLHEPLKVYTLEDMRAFEKQHENNPLIRLGGVLGGNFSIFQKVWMGEHEDLSSFVNPESMAAICQQVFKEAIDRLVQKRCIEFPCAYSDDPRNAARIGASEMVPFLKPPDYRTMIFCLQIVHIYVPICRYK